MSSVFNRLITARDRNGGGFLLLLDPDRGPKREYLALAEAAAECGVDAILAGSSFILNTNFADSVARIKSATILPVIILPGSVTQIVPDADAVLFTSLLSGRNATYLIDEQVKGAPLVKQYEIEPIPTGYLLVESGQLTSVQFASASVPIPRNKSDIACAHALAAQYLGMKLVYLEAGSGAELPVPVAMVREVSQYVDIPVVVGGGLRRAEDCAQRIEAGASFVVMGNHFESHHDFSQLREAAAAAHPKLTVTI
jgi:phosphoglycerol geranylgeranyltransferase